MIASKKKFLIYVLLLVVVVVFFLVWYFSRFYEGADGDANTNSDATTDDSDATTDDSDATAANNKVVDSDATTDNNDATAANNEVDSSVATPVVNSVATAAANPKLSKIDADYRDISNATVNEIRLGGVVTANQSEEFTYTANDGSTQTGNYTLTTIDSRQAGDPKRGLTVGSGKEKNVYTWEDLQSKKAYWENDIFKVVCAPNTTWITCSKYPKDNPKSVSNESVSNVNVYQNQSNYGNDSYSFKYENINGIDYIQDQLIQNQA